MDAWWFDGASEIQQASYNKGAKRFYDDLIAVYGNQSRGATPLMSTDGTTRITDRSEILKRRAELYNDLLNRPLTISLAALDEAAQHPIIHELEACPSIVETTQTVKKLSSGKTAGSDEIAAEIYKHEGINLNKRFVQRFTIIWDSKSVPKDFINGGLHLLHCVSLFVLS